MNGTAQERLANCILEQLRGWYADEDREEYRAIAKHRKPDHFSFIMGYPSSNWGIAFALITLHNDVTGSVQKVIMQQNAVQIPALLRQVQKFVVFYAVQQDEGGTCL